MKILNFKIKKILPAGIYCLFLALTSCSDEAVIVGPAEGEIPITIQAEISVPERNTRAEADLANEYDRSRFITNDVIRVTRTYNGGKSVSYYKLTGEKWVAQGTPTSLRIGATYQASYPSDYSSIASNQSTKANYLASNLLKTLNLTSSTGELKFTGGNAFAHQNTKITLVFSGAANAVSLSGDFSNFTVSGNGLYSGNKETEEVMSFCRPDNTVYTWCGIVYPQNTETKAEVEPTEISLSLTYDRVNYKAKISCPMVAGKHYEYNLTIQNNILVPDNMTIEGWTDTEVEGDHQFDDNTSSP